VNPVEPARLIRGVNRAVRVHDTITMKATGDPQVMSGIIVILDSFCLVEPELLIGETARIVVGESTSEPLIIRAVRDHGATISFFIEGLSKTDVPIGSWVEFVSIDILRPR